MKYRIILLLFVFINTCASNAYTQTKTNKVEVLMGEEIKLAKRIQMSGIVGSDESGMYVTKYRLQSHSSITSMIIERYNKELIPTYSAEVSPEYNGAKMDIEFILELEDELYLFSSFSNQKTKKKYLFAQSVSKRTLTLKSDLRKMAELDFAESNKWNSGRFSIRRSEDKSKFVIFHDLPYNKKEYEKFGFNVYDSKLNALWEQEVKLPYKEEFFSREDLVVDNNGNVFILGKTYKENRIEREKGKPNHSFVILSYVNGEDHREYPVSLDDRYLTDLQIGINEEEKAIYCGGFYSLDRAKSIKGSYFLKISMESKEMISQGVEEFESDFIMRYMTERLGKKTKKKESKGENVELYNYRMDDMILRSDGGAVLIGEQYQEKTITRSGTDGSTSSTTYYYFNDIIVISIAPDGQIEWTEKIPKRQVSSNDGGYYSSYKKMVIDDKLFFIFNDNALNLFYDGDGAPERFRLSQPSLVMLVELDREGNVSREPVFSPEESEILTSPILCRKVGDKELVLFGQKKKMHRFSKLTFKKNF